MMFATRHPRRRPTLLARLSRTMQRGAARALAIAPLLAATALAQGLPQARPEQVGLSSAALQQITPAMQGWVDSGRVAGAIAVVVRHGKLAFVTQAGTLDALTGAPVGMDAVFRICSMTKPIATAAVMQLIERGKLRLDDPVSKYIPAFASVKVYASGGAAHPVLRAPDQPITIAHLLTHTAGLTYGIFSNSSVDSIYRRANVINAAWTIAQMSDSLAHLPLAFSPGTAWNYSVAIDVLGRVVEVVSGTSFDQYLEREIFEPLAMRTTGFHVTPPMSGHITTAYVRGPDGRARALPPALSSEYMPDGRLFSGGGGLLSTPHDYIRFAQMLLNGGELDGHRVLKRETVALMMQNHLPPALTPIRMSPDWPPGKNGFAYGGAVRVDDDAAMPGSAGTFRWSGYASTFFWVDPKADLIAMVWTQFIPVNSIWAIDGQFQRLVYGAITDR